MVYNYALFLYHNVNRLYYEPPSRVLPIIDSSRGSASRADLSWSQTTFGRL